MNALVAQLVERMTRNPRYHEVRGSTPRGSIFALCVFDL